MNAMWVPVILAAIIVFGVVGGQLVHTVVKRLLPLLETLVEERQQGLSSAESSRTREEISTLRERMAELETTDRRLENLEEQVSFLHSLLEERAEKGQLTAESDD